MSADLYIQTNPIIVYNNPNICPIRRIASAYGKCRILKIIPTIIIDKLIIKLILYRYKFLIIFSLELQNYTFLVIV